MDDKTILREHGLKATPSRLAIFSFLCNQHVPLSAEAIAAKLAKKDIDLSTLYRTLNSFSEVGLVKKEVGAGKENLYSLVSEEECHYLVCLKCHNRIKLEGCPYHEVNETIQRQTGYRILDHNTEIYGICPDCQD